MTLTRRLLVLALPATLLLGCGQKGPLYLPGQEPPSMRVPTPKKQPPAGQKETPAAKESKEQR